MIVIGYIYDVTFRRSIESRTQMIQCWKHAFLFCPHVELGLLFVSALTSLGNSNVLQFCQLVKDMTTPSEW